MESGDKKKYISHIYEHLNLRDIDCLTSVELRKFSKRCLKGCELYIQDIYGCSDSYDKLLFKKIKSLLSKLDNPTIKDIVVDGTLRIETLLTTHTDYIYVGLKTKKIESLTDGELRLFSKRCLRSCELYIRDVCDSHENCNEGVLMTKIHFLLLKLDDSIVRKIVKDKTLRIKTVLMTPIYDINDELKIEREDILNKVTSVDSNSCNLYTCPRCKKSEHTMREVMTRAIDEPRTVKCTCLVCGAHF